MADKYNLRAWKRPVSRSYEFNLQVGENYYKHLTTYLDQKSTGYAVELPGALSRASASFFPPLEFETPIPRGATRKYVKIPFITKII